MRPASARPPMPAPMTAISGFLLMLPLSLFFWTGHFSREPATGRHGQHVHDLVAAYGNHAVHHVDHDAHVVGNDTHHITDPGPGIAARQVKEAVLLGEGVNLRLRIFED